VFPNKTATPEIEMDISTERKEAERLHLFKVFVGSVITIIQDVLQTS